MSATAWFATMRMLSLPLYLPSLVLAEVRAVRPDTGAELAELLGHPSVVLGELDATAARAGSIPPGGSTLMTSATR
ncbi:MAG: hypothetical protein LC775_02155 [Acidobacteria bacterium]|nr:hypothetical protein [Acidobacteriota bacterium]